MTEIRKDGTIIALVNSKGGIGKTTSAVSLAAGLAADGVAYRELAKEVLHRIGRA